MIHDKEWFTGPYTTKYDLYGSIEKAPDIKKVSNKYDNVQSKVYLTPNNNVINNKIKYDNNPPWKQACVKSHALFIWETKHLGII